MIQSASTWIGTTGMPLPGCQEAARVPGPRCGAPGPCHTAAEGLPHPGAAARRAAEPGRRCGHGSAVHTETGAPERSTQTRLCRSALWPGALGNFSEAEVILNWVLKDRYDEYILDGKTKRVGSADAERLEGHRVPLGHTPLPVGCLSGSGGAHPKVSRGSSEKQTPIQMLIQLRGHIK